METKARKMQSNVSEPKVAKKISVAKGVLMFLRKKIKFSRLSTSTKLFGTALL